MAREPLDEVDVDEAIAEGDEPPPSPFGDEQAPTPPSEGAEPEADSETPEQLEDEFEDGTSGMEEGAVHAEDAVSEVLGDERDIADEDAAGPEGDELEWRMDEETEPGEQETR